MFHIFCRLQNPKYVSANRKRLLECELLSLLVMSLVTAISTTWFNYPWVSAWPNLYFQLKTICGSCPVPWFIIETYTSPCLSSGQKEQKLKGCMWGFMSERGGVPPQKNLKQAAWQAWGEAKYIFIVNAGFVSKKKERKKENTQKKPILWVFYKPYIA